MINPYLRPPVRDTFPNSVEVAEALSPARQARVLDWITSEEASLPNKHFVAQNYCNFYSSVRGLLPGISIVNFRYAYAEAVLSNYGVGTAPAYDETVTLGHEDAAYLRQAWNLVLSGGSVFDQLDYSFSPGHEDGSDTVPNGPGGGRPALRQPLRILSDFLRSFSLADLRPDSQTIQRAAGGYPSGPFNPCCQNRKQSDLSYQMEVNLNLPFGDYSAEWISVSTGETTKREKFQSRGGEKQLQAPPI